MKEGFLIASKLISGAMSLLTISSIMIRANVSPQIEEQPQEVISAIQTNEAPTSKQVEESRLDSGEDTNTSQESGQGNAQIATQVNTQVKSAPTTATKPSTKPSSIPKTTTPAQTKPKQQRYTSVYDFEHAMLGVCPQNVPAGVWPDKLRPIVSLSYRPEERYSSSDIELAIDIYWSAYKQGHQGATVTYEGGFFNGDCANGEKSTIFLFDFNNNTVTYTLPDFYTPKGEQWAKELAQRGQSHLQWVSSQFRAKCGY